MDSRHPVPGGRAEEGPLAAGRRAGRDVLAFNAGIAALESLPDLLVKLDADVSFAPDYFERLASRFASDPHLGIAGGLCTELDGKGRWVAQHMTGHHVRGATRVYRASCFQEVSPLPVRLGWDGIDELTAQVKGWRTTTFDDLRFRHHRPVGQRDGSWSSWASRGDTAHYMRYRPSYLVVRSAVPITAGCSRARDDRRLRGRSASPGAASRRRRRRFSPQATAVAAEIARGVSRGGRSEKRLSFIHALPGACVCR